MALKPQSLGPKFQSVYIEPKGSRYENVRTLGARNYTNALGVRMLFAKVFKSRKSIEGGGRRFLASKNYTGHWSYMQTRQKSIIDKGSLLGYTIFYYIAAFLQAERK